MKAIGIYRESSLSGRHLLDQEIMNLVKEELTKVGFEVEIVLPQDFDSLSAVDVIFTMARGPEINALLKEKENQGVLVINTPEAIRFSFNRKMIYQRMADLGANLPLTNFYKTKDIAFSDIQTKSIMKPANRHEFWFIVEDEDDFSAAIDQYQAANIDEIIVQDFIDGYNFKYYAIDNEIILSKLITGKFEQSIIDQLREQILLTGKTSGLKIFGGDFIVSQDKVYCIDANDWPSSGVIDGISQTECASKIADYINKKYRNQ